MYLYICIRSTYHIGNLNRKIYEYNVYKFSTNASRRRNQPDAFSIPKRKRELTFSPPPFIRTSNKSLTVKKKKSRLTSLYFQECSFKRLTTLHFKHPPPPPFSLDSLHSRNSLHNSSTLSPPDFFSPLTIPSPISLPPILVQISNKPPLTLFLPKYPTRSKQWTKISTWKTRELFRATSGGGGGNGRRGLTHPGKTTTIFRGGSRAGERGWSCDTRATPANGRAEPGRQTIDICVQNGRQKRHPPYCIPPPHVTTTSSPHHVIPTPPRSFHIPLTYAPEAL